MTSRADSPSKGLHPYPTIPPLTSGSENASGAGPSAPRGSPTLSDIQANMLALQQAQIKFQMDAQADRATINGLAANLARLLDEDEAPRGRSVSRSRAPVGIRAQSEYHDAAPNSPIPSIERVHPARDIPEHSQYRSAKVPDPAKLGDGEDPTYDYWQIQIVGKFKVNADHYANEDARMYYVFNCTEGNAQQYLFTRYKPDATDPFKTAKEMIDYLGEHFVNPHRVREARREYKYLRMKEVQTFHEFKTKFIHLADEAQIHPQDRLDDLYDKLTLPLQTQLVSQRHSIRTLQDLYHIASSVDSELKALQARKNLRERTKARAMDTPQASTSLSSAPKLYTATPRAFTPARASPTIGEPAVKRESTPASTLTCFNCSQTGHIARDCPAPKRITDVKELQEDDELAEADTDDMSGNEDA
jgi:Zinc knuckle